MTIFSVMYKQGNPHLEYHSITFCLHQNFEVHRYFVTALPIDTVRCTPKLSKQQLRNKWNTSKTSCDLDNHTLHIMNFLSKTTAVYYMKFHTADRVQSSQYCESHLLFPCPTLTSEHNSPTLLFTAVSSFL